MSKPKRYLTVDRTVRLESRDKADALKELIEVVGTAPEVSDTEAFGRAIFDRESIMSTGIGIEIAVPHAKLGSVSHFVMAVGVAPDGIPWDSIDGKPVKIVVMIAGPDDRQEDYLRILSRVVLLLRSPKNRERLLAAESAEEIATFFHRVG